MNAARSYIQSELEAAGWSVARQEFTARWAVGFTDTMRVKFPRLYRSLSGINLVATQADVEGPFVVLLAHYDSVYASPGADDNASGVAVILEVARQLGESGSDCPVLLATVDLEEVGQFGSSAFASSLSKTHDASSAICLEMVGYYDEKIDSQRFPHGAQWLLGKTIDEVNARGRIADFLMILKRRSSSSIGELLSKCFADAGLASITVHDPRPDGWKAIPATILRPGTINFDRSDHQQFWRRNIPAVMLTDTATFRNRNYHRPSDTPETLDYQRLTVVAESLINFFRKCENISHR